MRHHTVTDPNPDGIFIFDPDTSGENGYDPEFAKEVCLALESALNSSSLNMRDNPQLFTKGWIPPDYDPARWGRYIDVEAWNSNCNPDFSGFINELRSDITETFSNLNIVDFSMKIDDQGKLTITGVQTDGNDPAANARALAQMNKGLTAEIMEKAEYLGLVTLAAHAIDGEVLMEGILKPFDDGSRGDIKQYRHEVIFTSGSNYAVQRSSDQSK